MLNIFRIYESLKNKRVTLNNKKPIFAIVVIIRKIMKGLTEREKIVLFAAAVQSLQEKKILWADLYFLSRDRAADSIAKASASPTSVSTWKNSAKVQNFLQKCTTSLTSWIDDLKQEAITNYLQNEVINIFNNNETSGSDQDREKNGNSMGGGVAPKFGIGLANPVDFSDRSQMMQALNRLAANAKDDKTQIDVFKIIADLQRFKDSAKTNDDDVKRFYMPLKCQECTLYLKQKESIKE